MNNRLEFIPAMVRSEWINAAKQSLAKKHYTQFCLILCEYISGGDLDEYRETKAFKFFQTLRIDEEINSARKKYNRKHNLTEGEPNWSEKKAQNADIQQTDLGIESRFVETENKNDTNWSEKKAQNADIQQTDLGIESRFVETENKNDTNWSEKKAQNADIQQTDLGIESRFVETENKNDTNWSEKKAQNADNQQTDLGIESVFAGNETKMNQNVTKNDTNWSEKKAQNADNQQSNLGIYTNTYTISTIVNVSKEKTQKENVNKDNVTKVAREEVGAQQMEMETKAEPVVPSACLDAAGEQDGLEKIKGNWAKVQRMLNEGRISIETYSEQSSRCLDAIKKLTSTDDGKDFAAFVERETEKSKLPYVVSNLNSDWQDVLEQANGKKITADELTAKFECYIDQRREYGGDGADDDVQGAEIQYNYYCSKLGKAV